MTVEGHWVDQVVGLEGVRSDIAMMRTPNGHGRLELARYQRPAAVSAGPRPAPANTLRLSARPNLAIPDNDQNGIASTLNVPQTWVEARLTLLADR